MTDLVKDYGYYSSGETFSIADKNEAWVMEMIGKGPGNKGAVWVAIRIPDDCISAHANQSRIQQIHILIHRFIILAKERPHTGFTTTQSTEIIRAIGFLETKILIPATEISLFTSKRDNIR